MSDPSRTDRQILDWLAASDHPRSVEPVIDAVLDASRPSGRSRLRALAGPSAASPAVVW